MMKPACLILAAGFSSRMQGEFKPVLPIDGIPLIISLIKKVKQANIEDITIVTGFNNQLITDVLNEYNMLSETVKQIYHPQFEDGMFSSICCGIRTLKPQQDFILFPVDTPLITVEQIQQVLMHRPQKHQVIYPTFDFHKGHPPYISHTCIESILTYTGNKGLKGALATFDDNAIYLEMDSDEILHDMDTPEKYAEVLARIHK